MIARVTWFHTRTNDNDTAFKVELTSLSSTQSHSSSMGGRTQQNPQGYGQYPSYPASSQVAHRQGSRAANTNGDSSYPEQNYGVGSKWVKHLSRDRLGTLLGGHYSDVNLSSVLFSERTDSKDYVKLLVWSAPGHSKPTFEEALEQADKDGWKEGKKGDSFGPSCELSLLLSWFPLRSLPV